MVEPAFDLINDQDRMMLKVEAFKPSKFFIKEPYYEELTPRLFNQKTDSIQVSLEDSLINNKVIPANPLNGIKSISNSKLELLNKSSKNDMLLSNNLNDINNLEFQESFRLIQSHAIDIPDNDSKFNYQ